MAAPARPSDAPPLRPRRGAHRDRRPARLGGSRLVQVAESAFTSSFHTRFPDYVAVRTGLSAGLLWSMIRHFHNAAENTFAVTEIRADELRSRGFSNVHCWPLGTDLATFTPNVASHPAMRGLT